MVRSAILERSIRSVVFAAIVLSMGPGLSAQSQREITLPGTELYPESITSSRDGALIVGSVGKRNVSRIAPGTTRVEEWIKPGTAGMNQVFGVLADDKSQTLWVCSDRVGAIGGPDPALMTFNLASGAFKQSFPLPDADAFCNDIALSADGAAYISDTHEAAVYRLGPGAKKFEVVAKGDLLKGADGIAFGDSNTLYVTGVTTNKLIRLQLGADGRAYKMTELKLSKAVTRPDGMRTLSKGRLLLAENGGNVDIVTFSADGLSANVQTIREDVDGATGVTVVHDTAWAAEGKLRFWEDPRFMGKDPGPFKLIAIQLPKDQAGVE